MASLSAVTGTPVILCARRGRQQNPHQRSCSKCVRLAQRPAGALQRCRRTSPPHKHVMFAVRRPVHALQDLSASLPALGCTQPVEFASRSLGMAPACRVVPGGGASAAPRAVRPCRSGAVRRVSRSARGPAARCQHRREERALVTTLLSARPLSWRAATRSRRLICALRHAAHAILLLQLRRGPEPEPGTHGDTFSARPPPLSGATGSRRCRMISRNARPTRTCTTHSRSWDL
jgi:hypothetical protein